MSTSVQAWRAGCCSTPLAVGQLPECDPIKTLSMRELEVFEMIGRGVTTQQIARKLRLSRSTIETHRKYIRTKLDLQNSAQLNRQAFVEVHGGY